MNYVNLLIKFEIFINSIIYNLIKVILYNLYFIKCEEEDIEIQGNDKEIQNHHKFKNIEEEMKLDIKFMNLIQIFFQKQIGEIINIIK